MFELLYDYGLPVPNISRDRNVASYALLSICVYHKQDDLWRIPLFIHTLVEDYRLFLRPHDVDGWQLVYYAVPANQLRPRSAA
jgi:hypothetical protein